MKYANEEDYKLLKSRLLISYFEQSTKKIIKQKSSLLIQKSLHSFLKEVVLPMALLPQVICSILQVSLTFLFLNPYHLVILQTRLLLEKERERAEKNALLLELLVVRAHLLKFYGQQDDLIHHSPLDEGPLIDGSIRSG